MLFLFDTAKTFNKNIDIYDKWKQTQILVLRGHNWVLFPHRP